ncbi:MAG: diguanylate cyclase, partial [Pseudomonadota bacterium]
VGTAERLAYLPEGEPGDALARRISDELERLNTLSATPPEGGIGMSTLFHRHIIARFEATSLVTPVPDVAAKVAPSLARFNAAVSGFLAASEGKGRRTALETVREASSRKLLPRIHGIRKFCRAATVSALQLTQQLETITLGVVLSLLSAFGWFILRPLEGRVQSQQQDISQLEKTVSHDPVTGLCNGHGLRLHLETLPTPQGRGRLAFLARFLSVSPFHQILDESFGKQLTAAIAARLRQEGHEGAFTAHLGEGKFFFLHPAGETEGAPPASIRKLAEAFQAPIDVGAHRVQVRVATGWRVLEGGEAAEEVLSSLNTALDRALRNSDTPHVRFSEELRVQQRERSTLAAELKR